MRTTLEWLPGLAAAVQITPVGLRRQIMRRVVSAGEEDPPARRWAMRELRRSDPASLAAAAGTLGRFSSHEWIGEVNVPTAVVMTMRDAAVPPHRQQKLADAIPGAEVFPVDGDHLVCGIGWQRFVPVLVQACLSVAQRAGQVPEDAPAI